MRRSLAWSAAVVILSCLAAAPATADGDPTDVVAHNDVVYLSPARQGWEGLPLGNGTLGAQVWQPDGLMFQLNTPLSGVYQGALCRVRLRTTPSMLAGMRTYTQRLSLGDATLLTDVASDAGKLAVRVWIPADADALVIQSNDDRSGITDRFLEIQTWRPTAKLSLEGGQVVVADQLKVQGEPDYRFALAAVVDGAAAVGELADSHTLRLRIAGPRFTVVIALAATREKAVDVVASANRRLAALRARGPDDLQKAHRAWWSQFWSRSFIKLASDDGVADYLANLWYLHLYAMAAGSRGEVPPKFNGGLWTDNRDEREWGSGYWHWNTQETYWPIFAANHLELHRPYQQMYWNMLPTVERWTRQTWETEGAQYQETIAFNGAMGVWEKERGVHPRLPVPKHVAHTNLILSSSAEIAMQFWWVYLYTGDEEFLRVPAYPLMKAVAAFYVNYLEKDASGRYIVYPSNAHETFWKVKNPATDLAALRYCFASCIEAGRKLQVDPDLQAVWQDRLDHLVPNAIDPQTGAILPYQPRPGETIDSRNAENPELAAVGVFPLITLGSPDHALGLKTFFARRQVNTYGWTTDSICAARLGLAEPRPQGQPQRQGIAQLLADHARRYQDHPSGLQDYFGRKPAIHPYLEGSGTLATAVGEMLLQSWQGVIHVCPALPKDYSADFTLLAIGGFEVTAHAQRGMVDRVSVVSRLGGPLRIVKPFAGPARVTSGGQEVLTSEEPVLTIPTQVGQTIAIVPRGAVPSGAEVAALPNRTPKRLAPPGDRWIGKPALASLGWKPPDEPHAPRPPAVSGPVDRPEQPEIRLSRLPAAPAMRGDLSDPAWQPAVRLGPLVRIGQRSPAGQPTDVLVGCDGENLFFGITCWESHMDGLLAEHLAGTTSHDEPVFDDDSVELYLAPPGRAYWHFAVNGLGAMFNSIGSSAAGPEVENSRIHPDWKIAVSRRSNRWIVEAAIPLRSIAADLPSRGDAWRLNVVRNERPHGETSTWAPVVGPDASPARAMGQIVFAEGAEPPAEKIEDADLAAHWTFDRLEGIWIRDLSGHRHHGMVIGGPVKLVEGHVGKALELTGAAFVEVADSPELNFSDAMTLALWVCPRRTGSMRLVDKGPVGGSDAYLLDTHPNNNIRLILRPAAMSLDESLPVGRWTHLAATFGSAALRVYVDGRMVREATGLRGRITPSDLPLRIGADSQGGSRFVGLIDDLRIYRRALSAEEVRGLVGVVPGASSPAAR